MTQSQTDWLARSLGFLILFLLFFTPASAFADIRATVRAQLDPDLTESERASYANTQYNDYNADGLTGIIHVGVQTEYLVLEGPASNINTEINELQNNWRTESVTTISTNAYPTWTFSSLTSHIASNAYDSSPAAPANTYARNTIRGEFTANADTVAFVDDYFQEFADDGLGGVMVVNKGREWIEIELEGERTYVEYWTRKLHDDSDLDQIELVQSNDQISSPIYDKLWAHTGGTAQNP